MERRLLRRLLRLQRLRSLLWQLGERPDKAHSSGADGLTLEERAARGGIAGEAYPELRARDCHVAHTRRHCFSRPWDISANGPLRSLRERERLDAASDGHEGQHERRQWQISCAATELRNMRPQLGARRHSSSR